MQKFHPSSQQASSQKSMKTSNQVHSEVQTGMDGWMVVITPYLNKNEIEKQKSHQNTELNSKARTQITNQSLICNLCP